MCLIWKVSKCCVWGRARHENWKKVIIKNLQSQEPTAAARRLFFRFRSLFALFAAPQLTLSCSSLIECRRTGSRRILMKSEMKISSSSSRTASKSDGEWSNREKRRKKIMWRNGKQNQRENRSKCWKWIKENEREHTAAAARIWSLKKKAKWSSLVTNCYWIHFRWGWSLLVESRAKHWRKRESKKIELKNNFESFHYH